MPRMRPALPALFLLLALTSCRGSGSDAMASPSGSAKATAGAAAAGFGMTEIKPGAEDLKAVLKAEAVKAKAEGRKPHVELWATWCAPCKAIKKSLDDPRMKAAFSGTHIVQLDIDAWGATRLDGAGLPSKVIPVFYALDDEGKPTGRKIDGGAWGDDIPENMAPPLDKFFHGG
jgi:thiol-disulfide isomerase/thioredoxin